MSVPGARSRRSNDGFPPCFSNHSQGLSNSSATLAALQKKSSLCPRAGIFRQFFKVSVALARCAAAPIDTPTAAGGLAKDIRFGGDYGMDSDSTHAYGSLVVRARASMNKGGSSSSAAAQASRLSQRIGAGASLCTSVLFAALPEVGMGRSNAHSLYPTQGCHRPPLQLGRRLLCRFRKRPFLFS